MNQINKEDRSFIDWFIDIPEPSVNYLTKPTVIDRILEKIFLPMLPDWVTPNQITKARILSIPLIVYFFLAGDYLPGTILFSLSAFSDALDGALARTKNKVTGWGMLYDPIADKILVGSVAMVVIAEFLSLYVATTIIFLEIMLVLSAYFRYKGKVVPAKTIGKTKMVLQCVGIMFILFYALTGTPVLLMIAEYILYLAITFALLSLFVFRSI